MILTRGMSASSQSRKRLPVSISRTHRYSTSKNATEKATLTTVLLTMPKRLSPWISLTMAAMGAKCRRRARDHDKECRNEHDLTRVAGHINEKLRHERLRLPREHERLHDTQHGSRITQDEREPGRTCR